jgi:DNA-binding CsgD family transcriptional regulator
MPKNDRAETKAGTVVPIRPRGVLGREPPAEEVVLGGRHYRLVPVDDPTPAPAAVSEDAAAALNLTARELQIAALVAEGMVNKQIAAELQISEWTVSTHLRRIFAKLGVDTRAAMVGRCARTLMENEPK